MNINKDFISRKNINGTGNPCKYIVIHETDNYTKGANARKHAQAQHDGNFADMSVHYYSGSDGVYQAAEHTCKCWHVGRAYVSNPNNPDCTNNNSIGIEICVNSDGNYQVARQNAIELTKYVIQSTGIPVSRVIRHYDAKGKHCPRKMMDNPALWQDFKNQLTGGAAVTPPAVTNPSGWKATGTATCSGNSVRIRSTPGLGNNVLMQLDKGNRFEVNGEKQNGWVNVSVQGKVGWMSGQYVKYDQAVAQPAPSKPSGWKAVNTATCTGNGVRVRSTPDSGRTDNIIRKLDKGNRFEIDGQKQNGFHHIKVEGTIAWISSKYVRED